MTDDDAAKSSIDAPCAPPDLHPRNVKTDQLKDMELIAQKIAPFGWHLQFHLDARELNTLADRLRKLPVDIVVDHLGHIPVEAGVDHPGFKALLALLREGRCWVKLSAPNRFGDPRPPYPAVIPYARALVEAAPARCVWATDWPHSRFTGIHAQRCRLARRARAVGAGCCGAQADSRRQSGAIVRISCLSG